MVKPKTGNSSENPFKKGAQVEVSFDEEGFRGSWYTATVLRPPPKKSSKNPRIHVQFDTLTEADEGEENAAVPLCENVDLILVRPIPPREARRRFRVDEDVDAFHNDGWWEGVVIAVLDGGDRYSVFFRASREQIDFPESELRLHREWVHGEWVPPLEDEVKDDARDPSQPPPSKKIRLPDEP
ncbi:hypothetical protein CASFOL_002632 [Castilleja foliolosa]|uniref:Agenet domain-containing protein n=1 Tax=Castilleja foliolosa TaxID=1961234 RepID=A0ABD3EFJ9_9LAMI